MDTSAPIITDAFTSLREDLYIHLDKAESLARKTTSGQARTWTRPTT